MKIRAFQYHRLLLLVLVAFLGLTSTVALAQKPSKGKGKGKARSEATKAKSQKPKKGKASAQKVTKDTEEDPLEDTSTSFDFDEVLLEGKFKAPSGMVLKGRVQQSKSQMVQLRKDFRTDLKKSRAAVRSIRPRD